MITAFPRSPPRNLGLSFPWTVSSMKTLESPLRNCHLSVPGLTATHLQSFIINDYVSQIEGEKTCNQHPTEKKTAFTFSFLFFWLDEI